MNQTTHTVEQIDTHAIVRRRFSVRMMSDVVGVLMKLREQKFTGAVSIHISQGTPSQYSTEEQERLTG